MKRRCMFLDNFPGFNFNSGIGEYIEDEDGNVRRSNTELLGSMLMNTMLKEVADFCDPNTKKNWSSKPHQQVSDQPGMGPAIFEHGTVNWNSRPHLQPCIAMVVVVYFT